MKPFTVIAIVLFSLIAILQLARFILGWEVSVNGVAIPTWGERCRICCCRRSCRDALARIAPSSNQLTK